jgi:hypothetical protein
MAASINSNASTVGNLVSFGWAKASDFPQLIPEFVPWLNVITTALDILELAGIIPDPISLLLSLFAGRPREQASLLQAQRLMTARNPAARLAGIQLERMVKEWDIVTSEGGSGRQILNSWSAQFEQNMVAQGVTLNRAKQLIVNATSEAAQGGLALEPELLSPLDQALNFNGPPSVAADLLAQYSKAIAAGKSIDDALKAAEQWVFTHENLRLLFGFEIGPYIVPAPLPPSVVPGPGGSCPPSYNLDPNTELCTLAIPVPGAPPTPTTPPGDQSDPDGDEITSTLCQQLGVYTQQLIQAMQGLSSGSSAPDPTCCQQVVTALGNVTTALASIAAAVAGAAGSPAPPVDLTQVIAALQALTSAVGALAPAGGVDLSPVTAALELIAHAISNSAGADTAGIVEQLRVIATQGDVDQAIFNALQQQGLITSADLQVLQGLKWSDALAYIIASAPVRAVWNFAKTVGADVDTVAGDVAAGGLTAGNWAISLIGKALTMQRNGLQDILELPLKAIVSALTPTSVGPIGTIGVNPDTVLADVAAVGLNMKVLTTLVGLLREGAAEQLEHITEMVTGILGFEELREVQIGPLVAYGIARVAELRAKFTFRQELPGASTLASLAAQRLLDSPTLNGIIGFTGLPPQLQEATFAAAYRGFNARQMLRLIETGLFSQGDITDELNFAGMRDASQKRMLHAAPWLATTSQRNQLIAALENAYVNGLLDDADLAQQVDQAEQNTDRDSLILARVQLQKRLAFVKAAEKAYREEYVVGVLTAQLYQDALQGIGLQPDWINARLLTDQAHVTSIAKRKADAEAAALARATATIERRAAQKNYMEGNIDLAALVAALALTGLTVAEAASWADLARLQKSGALRWIYGLQKSPAEATLLKARVTALSDQRKRLQISDQAFVAALQALGLPPHYVNSIHASADSMITPKTSAVTIPVETS